MDTVEEYWCENYNIGILQQKWFNKIQQTKKKCEDPILYRHVVSTGLAAPKMLTVRGLTFVTSFACFTSKDKERLSI